MNLLSHTHSVLRSALLALGFACSLVSKFAF